VTNPATTAPLVPKAAPRAAQVLVVEDDLGLARATKRVLLERDDCEVELAHDVADATAKLRERAFDAIISDFELPDGTGADVLRLARALHPDAPRILVTSHTEWSAAARSVNEGEVFRILQKPIEAETLQRTLDEAMLLKRSRDDERAQANASAREQRALAERNARLSVRASYLDRLLDARTRDLLEILLEGLELRARGARRRARCVAAVARRLGELCELAGSDLDDLELAGLLHGVGALAAGDARDDPFDDHATALGKLGHDLLRPAAFLRGVAWLIRDHEAPFGGGAAAGEPAHEEVSVGARALAVAVRWVALVGDVTRLEPPAHEAACAKLRRDAGGRLDPALVTLLAQHPADAWHEVLRAARLGASS
jgi:response regulator RpfG family c-di-GMP phosphodiesterase